MRISSIWMWRSYLLPPSLAPLPLGDLPEMHWQMQRTLRKRWWIKHSPLYALWWRIRLTPKQRAAQ